MENSNSETLILKDTSVRSIWTCLTASPCYSTNKEDKEEEEETNENEEKEDKTTKTA